MDTPNNWKLLKFEEVLIGLSNEKGKFKSHHIEIKIFFT